MRTFRRIGDFNWLIRVLALGLITLMGLGLPNFGFATTKVVESAVAQVCAGMLVDQQAQEATIAVHFDEKAQKYVSITWSRQKFKSNEFVTTIHRTHETFSTQKPSVDQVAFARYLEEISPLVELANTYFESRRGWGNQNAEVRGENPFSKKNLQVAKDYLAQSSYVIVRDPTGRLLGGMRNIQMRDQDKSILPEEKFLHITVPQMGLARTTQGSASWKNEAGAFVIEEGLSPEIHQKIRLEIWTHLYQFIFSKGTVRENFYDQAVHTYGDRKSVIMYKASGFQKLRIYNHNGKWVDYTRLAEKDIPPIMVDGEPWWPLVLLPQEALALNEKFSTGTRAQVDPQWLENRRRQMSDPEISTLQMGALFPNLLMDLESKDIQRFLSALTGLATIIESASEHMGVAQAAFHDRTIIDRAVQEVIKIREQLFQLVMSLSSRVGTMTEEQRHAITLFAGHILQLKDKASQFMFSSEFLGKIVFPFLADMDNAEIMMNYMNMARTPKQWLEETALVWDLSLDSEDQFTRDTKVAEVQLTHKLRGDGYTDSQINAATSQLQNALFLPPVLLGDLNTVYKYDYSSSRRAMVTLYLLTKSKPDKIPLFIKLAAARQYLQDRSKKP